VKIAAKHSEGERVRAGQHVEEWLFLSGIARQSGDIVCRHAQLSALVETHFADTPLALFD
jgi:hypothetical protein